jgi:hypothetical protein
MKDIAFRLTDCGLVKADIAFRLTDCGLVKADIALGLTQQLIVAQYFFKYSFRRVRNIAKNNY